MLGELSRQKISDRLVAKEFELPLCPIQTNIIKGLELFFFFFCICRLKSAEANRWIEIDTHICSCFCFHLTGFLAVSASIFGIAHWIIDQSSGLFFSKLWIHFLSFFPSIIIVLPPRLYYRYISLLFMHYIKV